ncbi:MAG: XdhC family aldehyde oxidoreductase maturation factor [Desulfovibrionales bacterium]
MYELLQNLLDHLESGRDGVLCTIVSHSGSTPRSSGSAMFVARDDSTFGTVGGGLVEARVQQAAARFLDGSGSRIIQFDMTGPEAAKAGMICGGKVGVLLSRVHPDEKTLAAYRKIALHLAAGRRVVLLSRFKGPIDSLKLVSRAILGVGGIMLQSDAPQDFPKQVRAQAWEKRFSQTLNADQNTYLIEPMVAPCTAVIVGAGHVGHATARLTALTGFRTVVMDDREEFANKDRFPEAAEIHVLPSFADCFEKIVLNRRSFVVILTRGHLHDRDVLAQTLPTEAGYIGMIGSRSKREAIYQSLLNQGFSQTDLDRVHCPIGLSIKAETPAEIGVSIVAEMIQARVELEGHGN